MDFVYHISTTLSVTHWLSMSYAKRGRNVVHKIHKQTATKLYKSAYTDASVTSLETCSSTSNWEAEAVDFYNYPDIHIPKIKGKFFLRIYKRRIPSFWSKEKDYSNSIRTSQYTVFATNYYSNRGLFILVHSVWFIYYIGLY